MKADIVRLSDIATIDVSSVDKKSKESEHSIKLCNFTDIFYNWAITSDLSAGFMEATTTE